MLLDIGLHENKHLSKRDGRRRRDGGRVRRTERERQRETERERERDSELLIGMQHLLSPPQGVQPHHIVVTYQ